MVVFPVVVDKVKGEAVVSLGQVVECSECFVILPVYVAPAARTADALQRVDEHQAVPVSVDGGIEGVEAVGVEAGPVVSDRQVRRYPVWADAIQPRLDATFAVFECQVQHRRLGYVSGRVAESDASREDPCAAEKELAERKRQLKLPEENLLYFIEKNSPALEPWQREILHLVRGLAQYFYPQKQTKVMNEGCATFVHHYLVNALFDKGLITEGALLEILHSHSNVIFQPGFDDPRYSGINPYALGFAMMQDIKRICSEPAEEDRDWFPEIAGCSDWRGVLKDAWVNYRDESFIRQFLSPRLVRELKLFWVTNEARDNYAEVAAIHNERGYREVIDALARAYDLSETEPDIQVADVDLKGDRELILRHKVRDAVPLAERSRDEVVGHIRQLWGYDVRLEGFDAETEKKLYDTVATGTPESAEE